MTQDHPTSLMLFAAGLGTRMRHLTADQPKPLIKVAGKPLVDRALGWVKDANIPNTVVNLHYKPDMLKAHLEGQEVAFSSEIETVLETGGGLKQALPVLGEGPVFTMNPDAVWAGPNPLSVVAAAWRPMEMDALLLLIPGENARAHAGSGDFMLDSEGRITRGPGLTYSGVQIIRTERLAEIDQQVFSLNLLWDLLIASRRAFGLIYPGNWCDVGTPEGITAAEAMLAKGSDV